MFVLCPIVSLNMMQQSSSTCIHVQQDYSEELKSDGSLECYWITRYKTRSCCPSRRHATIVKFFVYRTASFRNLLAVQYQTLRCVWSNETSCQSKADQWPPTNSIHKRCLFAPVTLTLTQLPWYTKFRTWPENSEDVPANQKWTF